MDYENIKKIFPDFFKSVDNSKTANLLLPNTENKNISLDLINITIDSQKNHFGIEGLPSDMSVIILSDILQKIKNYRGLIQETFSHLQNGGRLIISVPHQFLQERKFRCPSRYGTGAQRFYTPATLLSEIEEALPPASYRIRGLLDDDTGYDYMTPLDRIPEGNQDIIVAVEKITVPHWADSMDTDSNPCYVPEHPTHVLPLAKHHPAGTLNVISPQPGQVESVLVLKLDHRGDQLIAESAFREARALFPQARLVLVCGSWNVSGARALNIFDEILPFDIVNEDPSAAHNASTIEDWQIAFVKLMEGRQYSLAMDLSMHSKTRPLLKAVMARHKAGFDRWNEFPWMDIRLTLPVPSMEGAAERGVIPALKFMTHAGLHKSYAIDFVSTNAKSYSLDRPMIWGGYVKIPAGDYHFEFALDTTDIEQNIGFDICYNSGGSVLESGLINLPLKDGARMGVSLSLPEEIPNLEFRLFAVDEGPMDFRFSGVTYERAGMIIGNHQAESQVLLVRLAALRLVNPYQHNVYAS